MVSACSRSCASFCRRLSLRPSASRSCASSLSLKDVTSPAAACATPTYSSVSVDFLETTPFNGHAWLLQVEWQVAQKPAQAQVLATQILSSVTPCDGKPRAFLPQ
jgi:hypothetical protein